MHTSWTSSISPISSSPPNPPSSPSSPIVIIILLLCKLLLFLGLLMGKVSLLCLLHSLFHALKRTARKVNCLRIYKRLLHTIYINLCKCTLFLFGDSHFSPLFVCVASITTPSLRPSTTYYQLSLHHTNLASYQKSPYKMDGDISRVKGLLRLEKDQRVGMKDQINEYTDLFDASSADARKDNYAQVYFTTLPPLILRHYTSLHVISPPYWVCKN